MINQMPPRGPIPYSPVDPMAMTTEPQEAPNPEVLFAALDGGAPEGAGQGAAVAGTPGDNAQPSPALGAGEGWSFMKLGLRGNLDQQQVNAIGAALAQSIEESQARAEEMQKAARSEKTQTSSMPTPGAPQMPMR
jgi:hypothetical protein